MAADIDTVDFVGTAEGLVEADAWGAGGDHIHQQAEAVAAAAASLQRPGRSIPGQVVAEDEAIAARHPIRQEGLLPWSPISKPAEPYLQSSVQLVDLVAAPGV